MKKILMTICLLFFIAIVVNVVASFSNYEVKNLENDSEVQINSEHDEGYINYVVNLSTRKYHLPNCIYADIKDEKNKETLKNEDFLIEHGYSACKKCILWRR